MKSFYTQPAGVAPAMEAMPVSATVADRPASFGMGHPAQSVSSARIAVYDAPAAAPRVEEISSPAVGEYIEALATRIYELARDKGGCVPYTVVRELSENLIHAEFAEPVVSILDDGATIRFADQGPGISDKERAVLPGFTTATGDMKRHIRGVGSGLPIVSDFLSVSGGRLVIEDNLGSGAVVTITTRVPHPAEATVFDAERSRPYEAMPANLAFSGARELNEELSFDLEEPAPVAPLRLTTRQKQVLALVLESGSAGPSIVSRELGVGLSTAYRDLASLEDMGLISSIGGKRALTDKGMSLLDDVLSSS